MRKIRILLATLLVLGPAATRAQSAAPGDGSTVVGPPRGTVLVVGGGQVGPAIRQAFIAAAGGPDALIVDIPTAGGAERYSQNWSGAESWRRAGARNVVVLHTLDHAVANSDSLAKIIDRAGGVWFDGGRQYRLVDAYAETRTEAAFHNVLARGGVVGGSSAGATILGKFLVRGAPSGNNRIMDDPSHRDGFAFLRGTAIDQHVVARSRLPDLADSIVPRYPNLLPISEDEGTAWLVRGDTATIIGAGQAFAYSADSHDPGKPFLTLHPGDVFNLATRRVIRRASDAYPGLGSLVDSLMQPYDDGARGGATVLVASGGAVLVDRSYGIPAQERYMPATTIPVFDIGNIASAFKSLCSQLPAPEPRGRENSRGRQSGASDGDRDASPPSEFQRCMSRLVARRAGLHQTKTADDGSVESSVDELYRFVLHLDSFAGVTKDDDSQGSATELSVVNSWATDTLLGEVRHSVFGTRDGRTAALERVPASRTVVIILTRDPLANSRSMADRVMTTVLSAIADTNN